MNPKIGNISGDQEFYQKGSIKYHFVDSQTLEYWHIDLEIIPQMTDLN